jgi:dolichol-phosphate mannosyltransferase
MTMRADGACTVVVPVFNEAGRVEGVVDDVVREMDAAGIPFGVRILNDGSTDWSPDLESRLTRRGPVTVESFRPNRGKGAMVSHAFPSLRTEFAVVIDADGEYLARDIPALLAPLREDRADWVLGSRYGFGRPRPRQYVLTYGVNRVVNLGFFLLSGIRLRDLLTGLWAFRPAPVCDLRLREERFSFTAELACEIGCRRRLRLTEVPIEYRFRTYAEGKKIQWWETGTILLAMLRYRFRGNGGSR